MTVCDSGLAVSVRLCLISRSVLEQCDHQHTHADWPDCALLQVFCMCHCSHTCVGHHRFVLVQGNLLKVENISGVYQPKWVPTDEPQMWKDFIFMTLKHDPDDMLMTI